MLRKTSKQESSAGVAVKLEVNIHVHFEGRGDSPSASGILSVAASSQGPSVIEVEPNQEASNLPPGNWQRISNRLNNVERQSQASQSGTNLEEILSESSEDM